MEITKENILQDPYGFCEGYLASPQQSTEADNLFLEAAQRVVSFSRYGDRKPPNEAIIPDAWDYYTDAQRQVMKDANHPFWQAVEELTQQNSDNQD